MLKAGGEMTFSLSKEETGFLPNRNIVWWPYSKTDDKRIRVDNYNIWANSDIREPNPCKIGAYNSNIVIKYTLEENGKKAVFVKKALGEDGKNYPDFHCNFECYFNDKIHEIETLSCIKEVENDNELEHIGYWEIY